MLFFFKTPPKHSAASQKSGCMPISILVVMDRKAFFLVPF